MWSAFLKRSDWRLLRAIIIGFSLALLGLSWVITLQRLATDRAMALEIATRQQANLAVIVSENLEQLLDGASLLALASREWWGGSPGEVQTRLGAMRAANPAFLRVALYDPQGTHLYCSSPGASDPMPPGVVAAALDELAATGARALLMNTPAAAAVNAWHKHLLFPVGQAGAPIQGGLLVTLDLGYLLKVYQHIDFGSSGVVQLLTPQGDEVVEWRPEGLVLSSEPRVFPAFAEPAPPAGVLVSDLFGDGAEYLSSFRHAQRYAFVLVVSRDMQDILTLYDRTRARSLIALVVLTIIIVAGVWFIAGGIGRQGRLFSALLASHDKNRMLISQLEEEKGRAFRLAAHDHLTGLPNRRTFTELVNSHLNSARRHGGRYAMMYLDLDRFKLVNDTLGHPVGDVLLQTVATRLRGSLRESDIVARLGGDEFAIFVTGFASVEALAVLADKVIEQVGAPVVLPHDTTLQVRPSIGIAIFPRDGQDFETLCRNADAAMYGSKRRGRGTYTYYEAALNPRSEHRFGLEQRFARAMAENELVLCFQPQVQLSDFRIIGFEALVRWQHPELGMVYPAEFISMAEETGLIVELDEWVARACCRQLAEWQAQGLDCVRVAVNMSALNLQRPDLPERIAALLAESGVPADRLAIEITETVLLESLETASQVLRRLEAMGLQISLDDFGSGFSSLSYVRRLPIQVLKVDKEFVRDIRNSPNDAVLIASIISLAHNLGMQVLAEGVETVEQLIHLKTAGCDLAQGYYFSRPVPAEQARELLCSGILMPA